MARACGTRVARIGVATDHGRFLLKLYHPEAAEEATREIAGLRLAGGIRLASGAGRRSMSSVGCWAVPALLIEYYGSRDAGRRHTQRRRSEAVALSAADAAPFAARSGRASLSSMSTDPLVWWQRGEAAWTACQQLYAGPRYARLLDALSKLRVIAEVHLNAHRELWSDLARRPCHGNPTPGHLVRSDGRLDPRRVGRIRPRRPGNGDRPRGDAGRARRRDERERSTRACRRSTSRGCAISATRRCRSALTSSPRRCRWASPSPRCTLLGEQRGDERKRSIAQITRALQWVQNALGVRVGDPVDLLRPLTSGS